MSVIKKFEKMKSMKIITVFQKVKASKFSKILSR